MADTSGGGFAVMGNGCSRGIDYARAEVTCPTRVVTSTVRCRGGAHPRCPVKTDRPVPKSMIPQVMAALDGICAAAPVHVGQVLLADVCGTGAAGCLPRLLGDTARKDIPRGGGPRPTALRGDMVHQVVDMGRVAAGKYPVQGSLQPRCSPAWS